MKRRLKSFIIGFVLCLTVIAVAVGLTAVAGEALSDKGGHITHAKSGGVCRSAAVEYHKNNI
jgi:hypothetical protein